MNNVFNITAKTRINQNQWLTESGSIRIMYYYERTTSVILLEIELGVRYIPTYFTFHFKNNA